VRADEQLGWSSKRQRWALLCSALLALDGLAAAGCGATTKPPATAAASVVLSPSGDPWTTTLGGTHRLVGSIWSPRSRRLVSRSELEDAVRQAEFVLLGEQHDNRDHHRLQAALVDVAAAGKARPVVAWEMFDVEKQETLDAYTTAHPAEPRGLGEALAWEKTGWPAWETYLPIAEAASKAGLRLVAANFSSKLAKKLVFEGPAGLPDGMMRRLGLDAPLAPALEQSLKDELAEAHCGHLPATHTDAMVLAQRARDATLAENVVRGAETGAGRAVLIAGAGHVRTDRGVGALLAKSHPSARIVSVAFVEVDDASDDPSAYAGRYHAAELPFDFVWFTPRATADDPCAAMKPKGPSAASSPKDAEPKDGALSFETPYAPGGFPWPPEGAKRREAIAELAAWNEGGRAPGEKWHPQPRVVIGEPVLASGTKAKTKTKSREKSGKKATTSGPSWDTAGAMKALRRNGYVGVRRCFDAALRDKVDLEGRTVVDFEVNGSGHIVTAKASPGSAPDPRKHKTAMPSSSARSCIARALTSVAVPPARGKRVRARVSVDVWPGDAPLPVAEPSPLPGSAAPAVFSSAIEPTRGAVRACFDALEKRHPGAWGRLALRLDGGADGSLAASEVESTFPDAETVSCVKKAVETQRWPAGSPASRAIWALRWRPRDGTTAPPKQVDPDQPDHEDSDAASQPVEDSGPAAGEMR
jgi:uncharacterized iron-regulated protein